MEFDRPKEFEKIAKEMLEIYKKKNANYGNSFGETFDKLGIISAVTRLCDKMNRVVALTTGTKNDFESLEDTLLDIANYAIMTRIEMRYQEAKRQLGKEEHKRIEKLLDDIEKQGGINYENSK